jgi:Txe/YoeB family toxin of Txe-Axe toxin-antitoxin module
METTNNSDNTEKKENQEDNDSQTNQTSSTTKGEVESLYQELKALPYRKITPEEKLQGFVRFSSRPRNETKD